MAIDLIPKSIYPVVPQALGVPNLLRSGAQLLDTRTLGVFNASGLLNSFIGAPLVEWGVFDPTGAPIADYDSVFAVGYISDSRISDYPVEQGSFASYNKVDNPFEVRVTLKCGGSEDRRAAFLANCEAARKSLKGYTVTTPETTYENVNFTGIRWERNDSSGSTLLTVELLGREIRSSSTVTNYSDPLDGVGSDVKNLGSVQTVDDPTLDVSGVV